MKYQGKEIEIISKRKLFGKDIAEIRILSSGIIREVSITELEETSLSMSPFEISFRAIAAKIKSEILNQSLLSPFESNIIPLPHQILALEKVMGGQYLRFLLADEVGMGKTIEAGLVLKELKIKGIVKKVLVIVSKTAMLQWQQEMKQHFNETFHIYETETINALVRMFSRMEAENEINIFSQHNQLIVSTDSLKPLETRQGWSKEKVEEYNRYRIESVLNADFDLLIIDECHKVGGSTQLVGRFQMADILCNAIPNVLLLSATPHRGKSDHFRRILQLLDADAFAGEGMPRLPELEPYVIRTEKRQAIDYNGNALFNKRITYKIDVAYDVIRHAKQIRLYEAVTQYVIEGFNLAQQTKNNSYGFVMILFQRMVSSSTQAILDAMYKRADRLSGEKKEVTRENVIQNIEDFGYEGQLELDFEQKIFTLVEEAQANYETELSILKNLIRQAKDCLLTEMDAKVEFLLDKLIELKKKENNYELKFLIFTEFISTQFMLKKILEERGGYICEAINGSMDFDKRIEALKNFKGDAQILISTDAAGESLNMQFAHIVINYDMPWNPMVVEQRIGRVDRIGQAYEVVALNLLLDNSIDKRVYEVIETKLNQILQELGIDKTADVLDSTLERDSINKLYLTSLLNPSRFEHESANWLEEIKRKLKDYKSTEGALPILNSREIKVEKVDEIKFSPLPQWLENLTKNYLSSKGIGYQPTLDGLRFKFPGFGENIYTFNIKESVNNPVPVPLSLQHDIIQKILSDAVPFTNEQLIPVVKLNHHNSATGYFSIWHLEAGNQFESQQNILPVFISDEGDLFHAFAQELWSGAIQHMGYFTNIGFINADDSKQHYAEITTKVEKILQDKYLDLEEKINQNAERTRVNREKAFVFQENQMNKIGIENIRLSRLQRLNKEKVHWTSSFDSAKQVVPRLTCLILIKIENG